MNEIETKGFPIFHRISGVVWNIGDYQERLEPLISKLQNEYESKNWKFYCGWEGQACEFAIHEGYKQIKHYGMNHIQYVSEPDISFHHRKSTKEDLHAIDSFNQTIMIESKSFPWNSSSPISYVIQDQTINRIRTSSYPGIFIFSWQRPNRTISPRWVIGYDEFRLLDRLGLVGRKEDGKSYAVYEDDHRTSIGLNWFWRQIRKVQSDDAETLSRFLYDRERFAALRSLPTIKENTK